MKIFKNKTTASLLILLFIAVISVTIVLRYNGPTLMNKISSSLVLERDEAPVSTAILNMVKQRKLTKNLKNLKPVRYNETIPAFRYILNEKSLCKRSNDTDIVLLVAVFVGAKDFTERANVRSSWAAMAKSNSKLRLIFIIGRPSSDTATDEAAIKEESSKYHDIIQADFTDSYRNLTFKSFALFPWISTYCSNAKYVLKIDCDMKIDLKRILERLETKNVNDAFLCGQTWKGATVVRTKNSKWYVPSELYSPGSYPYYCVGAAYIVSKRIVRKLAKLPIMKTPFPVDDVYITGILRENLKENISTTVMKFSHHFGEKPKQSKDGRYVMNVNVL